MFQTGRQTAWMIYEHFKISDMDDTVLAVSDVIELELGGDNVQTFDTMWDKTIIAMQKQPGGATGEFVLWAARGI